MPTAHSALWRILLASTLALAGLATPAAAQQGDAGAYLAAQVAAIESDYRAAADWFGRALQSDPSNPDLMDDAIVANISIAEMAAAAEIARQLLKVDPQNQPAFMAIMAEQAKSGDNAAILQALADGHSMGALLDGLIGAWAELGRGNMTEALAGFDAMAATEGLEVFGLYHKALARAQAGDFEGADEILSGRAAGTIAMTRRGVIAQVQILSQLERDADALAVLERNFGADKDPQIAELRRQLTAGEPVPFDVARTATEGMAEAFYSLAAALNDQADYGYVLLLTRVASHLNPANADAALMTAGILEQQSQHDLAIAAYALVPASDPAFYLAEIGRADATLAAGRSEASLEILQALSRSHAEILTVHVALADALRRDEQFVDAIKSYDTAIGMIDTPDTMHWPVFYARGICHERQGDFAAAEADMRRALDLNPEEPQVLNYLGYGFVERGEKLDEALEMIQRAVAAEPESGYIVDSLAWAYYRLGRYQDALAPMEKASLLEPVDPIVTDHLGDVYWAVGRHREAEFQWHRALSFAPAEKDATRIRQKLQIGLDAVLAAEGAPAIGPVDTSENGN